MQFLALSLAQHLTHSGAQEKLKNMRVIYSGFLSLGPLLFPFTHCMCYLSCFPYFPSHSHTPSSLCVFVLLFLHPDARPLSSTHSQPTHPFLLSSPTCPSSPLLIPTCPSFPLLIPNLPILPSFPPQPAHPSKLHTSLPSSFCTLMVPGSLFFSLPCAIYPVMLPKQEPLTRDHVLFFSVLSVIGSGLGTRRCL